MANWTYPSGYSDDEKADYWKREFDYVTGGHLIYMPSSVTDIANIATARGYTETSLDDIRDKYGVEGFLNNINGSWGDNDKIAWVKVANALHKRFDLRLINCPLSKEAYPQYTGSLIRPFFCKVPIDSSVSSDSYFEQVEGHNPYGIALLFGRYMETQAVEGNSIPMGGVPVNERITMPLVCNSSGAPITGSIYKTASFMVSKNYTLNYDSYTLPVGVSGEEVALRPYFGTTGYFSTIGYGTLYRDITKGNWFNGAYYTDGSHRQQFTAPGTTKTYAFGDPSRFSTKCLISVSTATVGWVIDDGTSFDSNIPVFNFYNEHTPTDLENYLKSGVLPKRSDGLDTKFSLKINGLSYPNYRLNIIETGESDYYNNMEIHMRLSSSYGQLAEHSFDGIDRTEDKIRYLEQHTKPYKTFTPSELIDEFYHFSYNGLLNDGAYEMFAPSIDDPLRFRYTIQVSLYGKLTVGNITYYLNPVLFHLCRTGEGNVLDMAIRVIQFNWTGNESSIVFSGYTDDEEPSDDPNEGESDEGGESESDYPENEPSSEPSPQLSTNGVLTTTYKVTKENLQSLGAFLWSDSFLDNLKLVNNNPIENIVSIKALPLALSGTSKHIVLGNVDTGVSGQVLTQDAYSINVGRFTVHRHFNNFLDYAPYTKLSIYLPFVGMQELDVNTLYGKTLFVKYTVSVVDGTCRVQLLEGNEQGGYPLYTYNCKVGADLSITASNRAQVEGGYLASGLGVIGSLAMGNVIGATISGLSMAQSQFHSSTSGTCSPNVDFSINRKVWLIWDLPNYMADVYDTADYKTVNGKPYQITTTLSNLTKFIKCGRVKINSLPYATDKERQEIEEYLQNGVYVKSWGSE